MVRLLQWCTRVAGLLALILGVLIGRVSYDWLPLAHMTLGFVVVVALVLISISGFFAHLPATLPLVGLLWAGGAAYLGIQQASFMTVFMPEYAHWIVEIVHALLGIGAIGLAEAIGARVSRQRV